MFGKPDLTKGHMLGIMHAATIQKSMWLKETETSTYLKYESAHPTFSPPPTSTLVFKMFLNTSAFSDYLDFLSAEPNQN